MERHSFQSGGLKLSYLDASLNGKILIAMHAHWMEASTFANLAASLAPDWRVIAPDQRGHGYSDHAMSYTRDDYLSDLHSLYNHLGVSNAVLLGNSLGGVNAYQFASKYPSRVRAIIVEDSAADISIDVSFVLNWSGTFSSEEELANRVGPRILPYLKDSFRKVSGGWRLAFDPADMVKSQESINGNHWKDWLGSTCPALLIRGRDSRVTTQEELEEMASRRPNTKFVTLKGGHVVHFDNQEEFQEVVRAFLRNV